MARRRALAVGVTSTAILLSNATVASYVVPSVPVLLSRSLVDGGGGGGGGGFDAPLGRRSTRGRRAAQCLQSTVIRAPITAAATTTTTTTTTTTAAAAITTTAAGRSGSEGTMIRQAAALGPTEPTFVAGPVERAVVLQKVQRQTQSCRRCYGSRRAGR